jgi:hypothetical protein
VNVDDQPAWGLNAPQDGHGRKDMMNSTAPRIVVLLMALAPITAVDVYAGAWAVRLESDVKASFSWIWNFRIRADRALDADNGTSPTSLTGLFIEPMVGLSGSALFIGPEYAHSIDRRSRSGFKVRAKLGVLRTYNDPWLVEDDTTYVYAGVEVAKIDFLLGINAHLGLLTDGDEVFPSCGIGYGF